MVRPALAGVRVKPRKEEEEKKGNIAKHFAVDGLSPPPLSTNSHHIYQRIARAMQVAAALDLVRGNIRQAMSAVGVCCPSVMNDRRGGASRLNNKGLIGTGLKRTMMGVSVIHTTPARLIVRRSFSQSLVSADQSHQYKETVRAAPGCCE
jgi:hypothetical protein